MPGVEYSSASKGVGVRKQAQISPPPFFLRLSPIGGSGWEPSTAKVSEVGADPRKQGGGCAEAGTNFPTAFFFAAVACRRQRLGAIHPSGSKIHRDAGVQLFGQQQRRQNPPPTQVFSCSGSSSRRQKSTDAGKIHRRRRCSAVRAAAQPEEPKSRRAAAAAVFSCSGGSFFCGCRLTAAAAGSHPQRRQNPPPPQGFSWSGARAAAQPEEPKSPKSSSGGSVQLFGRIFFLRLSPYGGSGWESSRRRQFNAFFGHLRGAVLGAKR